MKNKGHKVADELRERIKVLEGELKELHGIIEYDNSLLSRSAKKIKHYRDESTHWKEAWERKDKAFDRTIARERNYLVIILALSTVLLISAFIR